MTTGTFQSSIDHYESIVNQCDYSCYESSIIHQSFYTQNNTVHSTIPVMSRRRNHLFISLSRSRSCSFFHSVIAEKNTASLKFLEANAWIKVWENTKRQQIIKSWTPSHNFQICSDNPLTYLFVQTARRIGSVVEHALSKRKVLGSNPATAMSTFAPKRQKLWSLFGLDVFLPFWFDLFCFFPSAHGKK